MSTGQNFLKRKKEADTYLISRSSIDRCYFVGTLQLAHDRPTDPTVRSKNFYF